VRIAKPFDNLLDVIMKDYHRAQPPITLMPIRQGRVAARAVSREELRAKGEHCQEWHWCTKPAGHPGACWGTPQEQQKSIRREAFQKRVS
jgi:hypothetical protein